MGKGSKRRAGSTPDIYRENWERIFGPKLNKARFVIDRARRQQEQDNDNQIDDKENTPIAGSGSS